MADYDSSLPIRTENAGDVDIFVSDATTPAQKLKVNADGSVDVNAINADIDIRDLSSAQDSVEAIQDTHDDLNVNANMQVGDVDVANGNPVPVSDAGGSLTVDATDLDIRDLVAATDSVQANLFDATGTAFSSLNPLPVSFSAESAGDEIVDFNTSAAVASDASVNHDYTVSAGKTFLGDEAWITGSGKLKGELLVNGAIVWVGFNSTANPNIRIPTEKILKASAAQVIRFTITNRDNQPQDVYSTLAGLEI
jgi:hypothetical protein